MKVILSKSPFRHFRMGQFTVDNGQNQLHSFSNQPQSEKVKVIRYGLMVHYMKAGGRMIKPMDMVD